MDKTVECPQEYIQVNENSLLYKKSNVFFVKSFKRL